MNSTAIEQPVMLAIYSARCAALFFSQIKTRSLLIALASTLVPWRHHPQVIAMIEITNKILSSPITQIFIGAGITLKEKALAIT